MVENFNGEPKLPDGWSLKALPEELYFISGKAHEKHISDVGHYVVVNSKFISSDGRVRKYSTDNFQPARRGDILMVMSDLPNGKALAKTFLVDKDKLYAVNQRVCILRARAGFPEYFRYQLDRAKYFLSFDDGVQQTHLLNKVFEECPVIVPKSVEEQKAIATALKDIDDLIASLDALIAKKRDTKQAAMQQLLTGKTRLPGFKGKWPERKLGTEIKMQVGFPFASRFFNRGGQGTKLVRNRDLHGTPDDTYYAGPFDDDYLITNGDVLVGMDGDFRPCLWAGGRALLNQRVGRIKCKSGRRALFFYYLLEPHLAELEKKIAGTTVKHLSHSDVENITCCFPENLEEQSAIGSLLRDVDNEIEMLEAKLSKAAVLKHGMMQQLLTGRIRLV
ncbi:restriction endonuclease subunit S [Gluconobacter oxydans]|uniref:restriction endonuclease subunit S n=1 Tax=Gluconobacter oxydans TaxID=442 RepID=UPI0020A1D3EA|nr:restriction endonuclease subunit S [Gluconobacter oxydans]MCP1249915.1 restriction endonuclease subunit S [Gluconobacter oxydans]